MQKQGQKIVNLTTSKGLKQKAVYAHIGWTKSGFSRKVNHGKQFDPKTLAEIAEFLGVTPEYLRDESRPFNVGDEIPKDVLIEKPAPPASEVDPLALLQEVLDYRKNANRERWGADAVEKQMERLTSELGRVADELMLTRLELQRNREEIGGSHDPD